MDNQSVKEYRWNLFEKIIKNWGKNLFIKSDDSGGPFSIAKQTEISNLTHLFVWYNTAADTNLRDQFHLNGFYKSGHPDDRRAALYQQQEELTDHQLYVWFGIK